MRASKTFTLVYKNSKQCQDYYCAMDEFVRTWSDYKHYREMNYTRDELSSKVKQMEALVRKYPDIVTLMTWSFKDFVDTAS